MDNNYEPIISNPSTKLPAMTDSMLDKAFQLMETPTSKTDIENMLGKDITVISYNDLSKANSIDSLLTKNQSCVILYPNPGSTIIGHWTCLFVQEGTNNLNYFDSYGAFPDEMVGDYNKALGNGSLYPHLLDLVEKSQYADNFYWNERQFQSFIPNLNTDPFISTCGFWCVIRIYSRHLNEKEFDDRYYKMPISKGIDPDLLVTSMICKLSLYNNLDVPPHLKHVTLNDESSQQNL